MKKILNILISAILLTVLSASCLTMSGSASEITVKVNGETLTFDENPVNENGRVLVPFRKIFEAMGCSVDWDSDAGTVTATTQDGDTIELTINSNCIKKKNGSTAELDTAPTVRGGRTLVPVRAISECIGARVSWDADTQTVNVSYNTEITAEFDEDDYFADYTAQATDINLDEGQPAEITASGAYRIYGTLSEGTLAVNVDKEADDGSVYLILDGANIKSSDSAPIYIKSAKKVVILLPDGTQSSLSSGEEYTTDENGEPDAALFSKSDLTITGSGTIDVSSPCGNGITSKDNLKITDGIINVTASGHGITGKDLLGIKDGTVTVNAGKDGMRTTNTDADKGNIVIYGGSLNITAGNDGIQAENTLCVYDGEFDITVGGGYTQAKEHTSEMMPGMWMGNGQIPQNTDGTMPSMPAGGKGTRMRGQGAGGMQPPQNADGTQMQPPQNGEMPQMPAEGNVANPSQGEINTEDEASTEESIKGIKAGVYIDIRNGSYNIDSADDAIHSNGDVNISNADATLCAGGDAIHADNYLYITDGDIKINESYEGLEGAYITIGGGNINVKSSDDGINVNDRIGLLTVSGGYVYVDANGDGLDANGDIVISGGTVYVDGPLSGGNGALDMDGELTVSSATVIATGSAGMAMTPSSSSTQPSVLLYFTAAQAAGTQITLTNSDGEEIAAFTPTKQFQTAVISVPGLTQGESYTVTAGEKTVNYTQSDISVSVDENGNLQSMGGMGSMRGGMGAQRMQRGQKTDTQTTQGVQS